MTSSADERRRAAAAAAVVAANRWVQSAPAVDADHALDPDPGRAAAHRPPIEVEENDRESHRRSEVANRAHRAKEIPAARGSHQAIKVPKKHKKTVTRPAAVAATRRKRAAATRICQSTICLMTTRFCRQRSEDEFRASAPTSHSSILRISSKIYQPFKDSLSSLSRKSMRYSHFCYKIN